MQNAVIYARYSSSAQRDVSIDQQIYVIKQYAETHGIRIVGTYCDRALTGKTDKRPEFQRLIRDSAKRNFDTVIVYALDRFARNRYDSVFYKHNLHENGVQVISATEPISDDPSGMLMEAILEGFAEYYSNELSRKITRGMDDNARKGLCNGALPLGYNRSSEGRYVINEAEAAIVKEAYTRIAAGSSIVSIIRDFNERGLHTKKGTPFSHSTFQKMLSNIKYIGIYKHGDIIINDAIPPIISNELYNDVQTVLRTKKQPRDSRTSDLPVPRRRDTGRYLLTGKIFCGLCGEPMIGISGTSKTGALHSYYVCRKHRNDTSACMFMPIIREQAEETVCAALKELCMSDEVIEWMADCSVEYQQKRARESTSIESLRASLTEAEKAEASLLSVIESGVATPQLISRYQQRAEEAALLRSQIAEAEETMSEIYPKELIVGALRMLREGDISEPIFQSSLIDVFLVAATFYPSAPPEASITGDGPCVRLLLNLPNEKNTVDDDGVSEPDTEGSYKEIWWTEFSLIRTLRFKRGKVIIYCSLAERKRKQSNHLES